MRELSGPEGVSAIWFSAPGDSGKSSRPESAYRFLSLPTQPWISWKTKQRRKKRKRPDSASVSYRVDFTVGERGGRRLAAAQRAGGEVFASLGASLPSLLWSPREELQTPLALCLGTSPWSWGADHRPGSGAQGRGRQRWWQGSRQPFLTLGHIVSSCSRSWPRFLGYPEISLASPCDRSATPLLAGDLRPKEASLGHQLFP